MDTQIRIEGANILRRNLRRVHKDLPKGMKLIHQEIAGPVAALAKTKARRRSGRMAGVIKPSSTTTMARVQAGPLVYVGVQHWGWSRHSISPNRFLTEAITEKTQVSLKLYEQKLGQWIDAVWEDNS